MRAKAGRQSSLLARDTAALRKFHPTPPFCARVWQLGNVPAKYHALFITKIQPSVQAALRGCSPGNWVIPRRSWLVRLCLRRALLRGCLPKSPPPVSQLPRSVRLELISPNVSQGIPCPGFPCSQGTSVGCSRDATPPAGRRLAASG